MKKILQTILFLFALIHSYPQDCKFWPVFDPITRTASIPFGNSVTFNFTSPNFTIHPYYAINPSNGLTPDPSVATTAPPNSTAHNVGDLGVFSIFSPMSGQAGLISFNSVTTTGFYLHVVQTVFRIDFDLPFTLISSNGRINVSGNAIIPTPGPGSLPGGNATLFFDAGITALRYQFTNQFFPVISRINFAFTFPDDCLLTYYRDADGDNFGDPNDAIDEITPGYVLNNMDCNDMDNKVHPGAPEICDEKDNDCNGQIDEGLQTIFYPDADNDGWGDHSNAIQACTAPAGYINISGDCNDRDGSFYPDAPELCDNRDNDCDGQIDEGVLQSFFYQDFDGDGFGDPIVIRLGCSAPSGYVNNGNDCNDQDGEIYPNAPELCDSKDNDCDGRIDDGVQIVSFPDADNDGWGDASNASQGCTVPVGYITIGGDCNDQDRNIHPNAPELCDNRDNNCDGEIDEGVQNIFYRDADNDGYGSPSVTMQACARPAGYSDKNTDCDDGNAGIHPGGIEICKNQTDENCDGQIGEGCSGDPFIVITGATVRESQGFVNLTVSLSKKSTKVIQVNYKTVNQQATSPADYIAKTGTLTIPAGSQSETISVIILADNLIEQKEDFAVELSKPKHASISVGTCLVTILDETGPESAPQATVPVAQSLPSKSVRPLDNEQKLLIKAMPNPTANHFTLVTKGNSRQTISIKVLDNFGRIIETKNNVAANGTYAIGHKYRPGIYYVEIVQGKNKTITKLIKQPN